MKPTSAQRIFTGLRLAPVIACFFFAWAAPGQTPGTAPEPAPATEPTPAVLPQPTTTAATELAPRARLTALRILRARPSVTQPWAQSALTEVRAAGVRINEDFILTDLEAVRHARVIERMDGERATPLRLEFAGFDCGLALLARADGAARRPPPGLTELNFLGAREPAAGEELELLGFERDTLAPAARRAPVRLVGLSELSGSDVDRRMTYLLQEVYDSPGRLFAGGPALFEGKIVGVLHVSDNAPPRRYYALSASVIRRFFEDIQDGRYNGYPRAGFDYQTLTNPTLRRSLGLAGEQSGVYITRLDFRAPAATVLAAGDVLVEVDGLRVLNTGHVGAATGGTPLEEALAAAGRRRVIVLRRGAPVNLEFANGVYPGPEMQRSSLDSVRRYFLGGGLVFQELDYDLVHGGPAGERSLLRYRYQHFLSDRLGEQTDRDVTLTARLPDPLNNGMDRFLYEVVHSVNGRRIRSLEDFAAEWRETRTRYLTLRFVDREDELVLPFDQLNELNRRVEARYQLEEQGRVR